MCILVVVLVYKYLQVKSEPAVCELPVEASVVMAVISFPETKI